MISAAVAATWTEVGKTSLEDCEALTWSFGWTPCRCRRLERARGQLGDDLVGVHVRRRARTGLEDVDREVAVVLARGDLVRGGDDGVGQLAVEHAEFGVGARGGLLDPGQGLDVGALERLAGDREVLDGALGLRAVQGVRGDADLAHGVVLDAELFSNQQ